MSVYNPISTGGVYATVGFVKQEVAEIETQISVIEAQINQFQKGVYTVNNTMSLTSINGIIANTEYSKIIFSPGTYSFSSYLLIARNNVILDGQNGAILFMNNASNKMNIMIGDIVSSPIPTIFYSGIKICNFIIDGNRTNQSTEIPTGLPGWCRNTNIDVGYSSVIVDNCTLKSSISGGTALTEGCKNCIWTNCTSYDQQFDSYTFYGCTNMLFSNCISYGNSNGAGFSIDTGNEYVTITNCSCYNSKLGMFIRWGFDFNIVSNLICANAQQGMFIAGNYDAGNIGFSKRFVISSNSISRNGQQGIYLQSCSEFNVSDNVISSNSGNAINIAVDNATYGLCSNNSFSSNICNDNGGVGFYNDASNSYAAGARSNFMSNNIIKNNTAGNIIGDFSAYTIDDDLQLNTEQLILNNSSGNYPTVTASSTGSLNLNTNNQVAMSISTLGSVQVGVPGTSNGVFEIASIGGGTVGFAPYTAMTSANTYALTLPLSFPTITNMGLVAVDQNHNMSFTETPTLNSLTVNGTSNLNGVIGVSASLQSLGVTNNTTIHGDLSVTSGASNLNTVSCNSLAINNSGHSVTLYANPTGTCNFQFPANGGTANSILQSDGFGNTSWVSIPNNASSSAVGAYYSGANTLLTLSGVSQNIPGLSASITLPSSGNYRIRADYVVNLEGISLNSNVYCYASGGGAIGAGTGAYIQAFTPPSSTSFCTNVLTGSGFLNNFGAGVVGISPYSFTGGSTITVNVQIYTSSTLSTNITYITGEPNSTGGYWTGSNLVLSCVPV